MRLLELALLGAALSCIAPNTYAVPDELEIHLDDTTPEGAVGAELVSNYAIKGPHKQIDDKLRSPHHLLQLSPDVSYGLTNNTQADIQLFSSIDPHGASTVNGGRLEVLSIPIRPPDSDDDGSWLGALLEVGHLPPTLSNNHLDGELKVLTGLRTGRWTIGLSPEFGFKVSGNGASKPDLELKLKIAYRTDSGLSAGIEQYSDLGTFGHFGPLNQQAQQTFAVVDFKNKSWDFNLGIGRGWNNFSERWTVKAIVGFAFDQ